jgi:hypothetical protein
MMETAEVMTAWSLLDGNNHPMVDVVHTLAGWEERTGNPMGAPPYTPDPNSNIVQVWAETVDMDAILADPNFVIMEGTRGPA